MANKLNTLVDMFNRVEGEITTRQNMLVNLEKQIMGLVNQLPANVIKEYGVVLPDTLKNSRQRIDRETEGQVLCHMRGLAEQLVSFTRPELVDAVSNTYTHISTNILNRLFDAQEFKRTGTRVGERGNPIVYTGVSNGVDA